MWKCCVGKFGFTLGIKNVVNGFGDERNVVFWREAREMTSHETLTNSAIVTQ
jgi:hypothetical protein